MIMYSDQRDDNACWGDNEGNSNNIQAYIIVNKNFFMQYKNFFHRIHQIRLSFLLILS